MFFRHQLRFNSCLRPFRTRQEMKKQRVRPLQGSECSPTPPCDHTLPPPECQECLVFHTPGIKENVGDGASPYKTCGEFENEQYTHAPRHFLTSVTKSEDLRYEIIY